MEERRQAGVLKVHDANRPDGLYWKGLSQNDFQERNTMADDNKNNEQKPNLYQAEYLGSGSFRITKPKRKKGKQHETKAHHGQRRARRHG